VKRWLAAILLFALLFVVGCAGAYRPATGTGKATARVCELRRIVWPRVEVRRLVIVNNPTDEDVIVDCDSARYRFAPHTGGDLLLMPGETHCDMMNDTTYVPIPDVPIGVMVKNNQGERR
jgi:hypothetical protein